MIASGKAFRTEIVSGGISGQTTPFPFNLTLRSFTNRSFCLGLVLIFASRRSLLYQSLADPDVLHISSAIKPQQYNTNTVKKLSRVDETTQQ